MTRILLAVLALPTIAALAVLVAIARLARELRDVQPDTVPQSAADDSEVVGMPTWEAQALTSLGLDPSRYRIELDATPLMPPPPPAPPFDWDAFFDTAARRN